MSDKTLRLHEFIDAELPAATLVAMPATIRFRTATALSQDGQIAFDVTGSEAREAEIVKRLLSGGRVAIVVLAGAHDLTVPLK